MRRGQRPRRFLTIPLVLVFVVASGSACGDDNGDGDGGINDNNRHPTCGNGVIEGAEECDDASQNSDSQVDACRTKCVLARCGDFVVDTGEACDSGDRNSDVAADACRRDCSLPFCGDAVVDKGSGESCDDGNTDGGDGCSATCRQEYCGNAEVEAGEVCDDGNTAAGDGCTPDCLSIETCPNGSPDFGAGETCDCGTDAANLPPGCTAVNGDAASPCDAGCQSLYCGNTVVDTTYGEVCDDGNLAAGDGCSPDCLSDESCGNGRADFAAGETCDCGVDPTNLPPGCTAVNGDPAGRCGATCQISYCGNGVLDPEELCDDENNLSGDGCSADCLSWETCGNGYVDSAMGELCDDGNTEDGDDCTADCTLPTCGDGVLDPGEACDDANRASGDGCNALCSSNEACGDGIVDVAVGEICDDGNTVADDECNNFCVPPYCGNGYQEPGEMCDDGNTVSGDGCSADCLSNEECGNAYVDIAAGEQCDDWNLAPGDGCSPTCQVETGWRCLFQPSRCSQCGNGVVEPPFEECDGGNLAGQSCVGLGYMAGTLACNGACRFDTSGCLTTLCGNGVCDAGEQAASCASDCAWVDVDAAANHTCAVRADGSIWCWGANNDGRLGNDTVIDSHWPARVSGITTGAKVACGDGHSCAILSDSTVHCWGLNSDGQLGTGDTNISFVPRAVVGASIASSISCGSAHTIITATNSNIWTWGVNSSGELGAGDTALRSQPFQVPGLGGTGSVAAGEGYSCAATNAGLYCWGKNDFGQLGDNSIIQRTSPTLIGGITEVVTSVSTGLAHTCAVGSGFHLWCWGHGLDGRLLTGSLNSSLTPVMIATGFNIGMASAGGGHTCVIKQGGIQCGGINGDGQLGDGTNNGTAYLVLVPSLSTADVVTAGDYHSCAISLGRLFCWGDNGTGQIGDGTLQNRLSPVEVLTP